MSVFKFTKSATVKHQHQSVCVCVCMHLYVSILKFKLLVTPSKIVIKKRFSLNIACADTATGIAET